MSVQGTAGERAGYVDGYARGVPEQIMRELVREANVARRSVADTVLLALAEWSGQAVTLSGRRSSGSSPSTSFQFRMPESLKRTIWHAARLQRTTESSLVISVLARRYSIPYTPTRRGRPRKEAQA